jgi:membrane-associated phospholipid phosphatase
MEFSVAHQLIHSVDTSVFNLLNRFAGNWFLDHLASFEEDNNLLKGGLFLAIYVYLWFRTGLEREKTRRTIIAIITGTLLALVAARAIADLAPYRARPIYEQSLSIHPYSFPVSRNMENWSSFPSDTAAYFSALAFGLAYLLRRYSVPLALYTAGWICLPRMFLGEHYASDIVVGAVIGIALVAVSLRLEWIRLGLARHVLRWAESNPGVFYGAAFLACFEMGVLFDDVRAVARWLFRAASR